jgi:hypothetical protein
MICIMTTTTAARPASIPDVVFPLFLGVNLLVYLAYGVGFLLAPQKLAALLDITLNSPTALADFRAMYGGLGLGCAAFFALAIKNVSMRHSGLLLAVLGAAGLMIGRLFTMAVDGIPGPVIFMLLATEVFAVVGGLFLLKQSPSH